MKMNQIAHAVALLGLAGSGLLAHAEEAQKTEKIEITGSSIKRVAKEGASPVQTLTREDIEKSGKATVAELLQTLAVDNQGSVPTTFGSGFAGGGSGISLRGLGAASTLVLVNGRRVAPYGLADDGQKIFADLNMIPAEAVARVEILKDGASSTYGSDAIAGVVNVILRKDFNGTAIKATAGTTRYKDGTDIRASITHGFGDLDKDRFNALFNFEYGKKDEIWNRDRAERQHIGRSDLREYGYDSGAGLGGTGAIPDGRGASSSVVGNVRNPDTLEYFSRSDTSAEAGFTQQFAGSCALLSHHIQGDPNGGCLTDSLQQYGQIQPSAESYNLFGRGALQLSNDAQLYSELNYYHNVTKSSSAPFTVSGSVGYPGGPVNNAGQSLGATHPDNPYFGRAARLRYVAWDVGPAVKETKSDFVRALLGAKGNVAGWDYDSGLLFSQNKVTDTRRGNLQRDVAFALLNPTAANVATARANSPAYAALPAGTVWRIGENAYLNSREMYAALSPDIHDGSKSQTSSFDLKASRDLMDLSGGALALAVGAEYRREKIYLTPTEGTERGNIIGLGYSAYEGSRNVSALFAEVLAPVSKQLELSAALRTDHYSDTGNSTTPKLGFKWTPSTSFALRGTYAEGFRAPSSAENGKGGLAAFSTASDPLRCALGVTTACSAGSVAIITSPNPDLKPEQSKSYTLGLVWDPTSTASLSADLWRIKRRNEINQETTTSAIAAGHVIRDPAGKDPRFPTDPGPIVAALANYINSNQTTVDGIDLDGRQRFNLGEYGKLTLDAKWTHLFKWLREEKNITKDFVGTHGNCDVTNCMGTPQDRINLGASWDYGTWRVSANANYRGALDNINYKGEGGCATQYADGRPAPDGCRIASFTTVDMTFRWKVSSKTEVFGSIQNLFDVVAPLDPLTYGAPSYNPLDYSGAAGRYFSLGAKHSF